MFVKLSYVTTRKFRFYSTFWTSITRKEYYLYELGFFETIDKPRRFSLRTSFRTSIYFSKRPRKRLDRVAGCRQQVLLWQISFECGQTPPLIPVNCQFHGFHLNYAQLYHLSTIPVLWRLNSSAGYWAGDEHLRCKPSGFSYCWSNFNT